MMNKTKSAKRQVGRFLLLFPVLAIILLAFRKSFNDSTNAKTNMPMVVLTDTIPDVITPNSKGYYIDIKDNKGDCMVVIKDKDRKEVKRLLLTEWNEKAKYYEDLFGEIPPAPIAAIEKKMKTSNPDIKTITINDNIATVTLKNGETKVYTISSKNGKKAFEERCEVKEVAIATTVANELNAVTEVNVVNETIADNFEITNEKAVMHLRNGKVEEYNLADPKEKAAFEKKFGKLVTLSPQVEGVNVATNVINPNSNINVVSPISTEAQIAVGVGSGNGNGKGKGIGIEKIIEEPVTVTSPYGVNAVKSTVPSKTIATTSMLSPEVATVYTLPVREVAVISEEGIMPEEGEIILTITKKNTSAELESFKKQMKEKGFELKYDKTEYKNGVLVNVSGTLTSKDNTAKFSGTDFSKIVVSKVQSGEKIYFRINVIVKSKTLS